MSQRLSAYSQPSDVSNLIKTSFTPATDPTDAQVKALIASADSFIDTYAGHSFAPMAAINEEHDGVSAGPRAGTVLLKKYPVLSIDLVEWWDSTQWQKAQEGKPNQYQGTQTYEAYMDTGKIVFYRLRLVGPKVYRVSYTWGWSTVPEFVRDLSASLAGLDVLMYLAGNALERYDLGSLRKIYAFKWPSGAQEKRLLDKIFNYLQVVGRMRVAVG